MTPPCQLVHLGLGNFFRSHQAWYTQHADDGDDWSIAAFTGRRRELADVLSEQGGRYTLITRGADRDHLEVVSSIGRAHAAGEHEAWRAAMASPRVAAVTITVTEGAYLRAPTGGVDRHHDGLQADIDALRQDVSAPVGSVPARLVAGLLARRSADAGPIAIVPCDNLPGNGDTVEAITRDAAALVDPSLLGWLDTTTSFVTTMVDRITPASSPEDRELVLHASGWADRAPVVTEPFSEWVLSGSFPAGRPAWERAGATFTDDVEPFERRKLWLLNGAHSLLAYAGQVRGHHTVDEAVHDEVCRSWITQWWDEASPHLALPPDEIESYRAALLERFGNPRMRHRLAQIAADGSQKVAVRIVPALKLERAAGRSAPGATRAIAAWLWYLRNQRDLVADVDARVVAVRAQGPLSNAVVDILDYLDTELADDSEVVRAVTGHAAWFERIQP